MATVEVSAGMKEVLGLIEEHKVPDWLVAYAIANHTRFETSFMALYQKLSEK